MTGAAPVTPPQSDTREADRPAVAPSTSGRLRQQDQDQNKKQTERKTLAPAEAGEARTESAPLEGARARAFSSGAVAADKVSAAPAVPAPATAPSARPAAASEMSAHIARRSDPASIEIVSPDPSSRWRVNSGTARLGGFVTVVQRSTDRGVSWSDQSIDVPAQITAGWSPSASVCWLVGRGGMVLLSGDGRTWQHRPFPQITDLVAVRATDATTATVTAADGRTFTTKDGGLTWDPNLLQESSTTPF
jgi:photosystem II stability/assembly factor-like uncharacterized protein